MFKYINILNLFDPDCKSMGIIFHSSAKLIVIDSDKDKAFGYIRQSVMTKIKDVSKYWIVKTIAEQY